MAFHERGARISLLILLLLVTLAQFGDFCFCRVDEPGRSYVFELTPDTITKAIAKKDVILVEFYAPWCSHCKHLAPEYERASKILFQDVPHIKLAKIDADKYRSIASTYNVDGYPTLRLYTDGIPTEASYEGRRSAEAIVEYVKRSIVPAVSNLTKESEVAEFVKRESDGSPVFLGFGLESSTLEDLARKHRRRALFAVVKDVSDKLMVDFDFDKTPALVGLHPKLEEQAVFYGPFEGFDIGDFVLEHLMPTVSSVDNPEIVQRLKEDGRPIAIGVVESKSDTTSRSFIQNLKAAAPANRAFVFAFVEASTALDFLQPFGVVKTSTLPILVIWDGESHFSKSQNVETFVGEDAEVQLTKFLQNYRDGKVKHMTLLQPPFLQLAKKFLFGGPTLFLVCTIIVVVLVLQGCRWNAFTGDGDHIEDHRDRARRADLEGDVMGDRISGDSPDPSYFARKSEKRD